MKVSDGVHEGIEHQGTKDRSLGTPKVTTTGLEV